MVEKRFNLSCLTILERLFRRAILLAKADTILIDVHEKIVPAESPVDLGERETCQSLSAFIPIGDSPVPIQEIDTVVETVQLMRAPRILLPTKPK